MDNEFIPNNQTEDEGYESIITAKVAYILNSCTQEFAASNNSKEMISAANNFNPQNIISSINQLLFETENWFILTHNDVIREKAKKENVSPNKWLLNNSNFNWISSNLSSQKKSIENSVNNLDNELVIYAKFLAESSGFKGAFNGFLHGLKDPIDGIKGLWGDSSYDREAQLIDIKIQKAGRSVDEAFIEFDQHLRSSINTAIANITSNNLIEIEIEIEAEEQRKSKEEHSRENITKNTENKLNETDYKIFQKSALVIMFLLIIIVVLLVILYNK